MSGFLEIENLSVTLGRGGPRLLRDVSLRVQRQEVQGLVGESGAGKSMIGKAIAGLLPRKVHVVSGAIRLDGADLLAMRPAERRRIIGARTAIIPQDPLTALNPCRRIGGQITDRLVRTLGWDGKKAIARAEALLDEVHIREPQRVLRAYPHELSGGMRQRVLIAAAFAAEPELIIADEPTTALDVTVQKQILRLIHEMQHRHHTALLFVTHDMGVVAKICQQVTVLYAGKVVSETSAADLFSGKGAHPYAQALIAATPRFDAPEDSLRPVPQAVIDALDAEIAADDLGWRASDAA
jgi:peptide/nickel transport system ATP-binding protein